MSYRIPYLAVALASLVLSAAIWIGGASLGASMARADFGPPLSAATVPPTELVYLSPRGSVTYASEDDGYNCPRVHEWFTDVSAYTWKGAPLGAQHWSAHHTVAYWRGHRGRVTFNGITFYNGTDRPVLVAGWCA